MTFLPGFCHVCGGPVDGGGMGRWVELSILYTLTLPFRSCFIREDGPIYVLIRPVVLSDDSSDKVFSVSAVSTRKVLIEDKYSCELCSIFGMENNCRSNAASIRIEFNFTFFLVPFNAE
jgi:hypothetical protein